MGLYKASVSVGAVLTVVLSLYAGTTAYARDAPDTDCSIADEISHFQPKNSGYEWSPERINASVYHDEVVDRGASRNTLVDHCGGAYDGEYKTLEDLPGNRLDKDGDNGFGPKMVNYSARNGRLQYHNPMAANEPQGGDGHCSGSVLDTPSGRLVVTAAHCVHGGAGGVDYEELMFAPYYHNGVTLYKFYPVLDVVYGDIWSEAGGDEDDPTSYNRDIAFLVLGDDTDGLTVRERVGGHNIEFNAEPDFNVSIFGYPEDHNNGEEMLGCWGETSSIYYSNVEFHTIDSCVIPMGHGASGGPWLKDISGEFEKGTVATVTSWRYDQEPLIHGPMLDDYAWGLLEEAERLAVSYD